MLLERKKTLAVYYWAKGLFSVNPKITVTDEFPATQLKIPTVAIEWDRMVSEDYELGNRAGTFERSWIINVFAETGTQRDDFTYLILEALENPIPVHDYDVTSNPPRIGSLICDNLKIEKIRIMPELVDKLYYRSQVRFSTLYNTV